MSHDMARSRFALTTTKDGFTFPNDLGSARKNFDVVFHMIGGNDRMADWADKNPGEFYKHYAKNIEKQVDKTLTLTESLEQKLARLEAEAAAGDRAINVTAYAVDGVPKSRETVSIDDGEDE